MFTFGLPFDGDNIYLHLTNTLLLFTTIFKNLKFSSFVNPLISFLSTTETFTNPSLNLYNLFRI